MVLTAREFSSAIDVLISEVRDQQQTLDLYFEQQGIFLQSRYPRICLLASTVSPRFVEALDHRMPDDVLFFEISMSGAPIAAELTRLNFADQSAHTYPDPEKHPAATTPCGCVRDLGANCRQ